MRNRVLLSALLFSLALAALVFRTVAADRLVQGMIKVHGPGSRTPAARGLAFDELRLPSGPRTLHAFYVPAEAALAPAVLIFHGNGEAVSGWIDAIKILHDDGVTAMVFDYSGFGQSTGAPTLANFHQDALVAWRAFRTKIPVGVRACAYGLSLGTAVLLEAAPGFSPAPDCVALSGAFTSGAAVAVLFHRVPAWASALFPSVLDNVAGVEALPSTLLIEHGSAAQGQDGEGPTDGLFPVSFAERLHQAHPGSELVIVPGMRHADPVAHPSELSWAPIVRHVKGLPPLRAQDAQK